MTSSQARSPLLTEPDQALIDHFSKLMDSADWWVALKLTRDDGVDATQENAKAVCRKLMLRLHPDKCKLPAAAEAFRKFNHFRDKIAKRPYSTAVPAHASGIRPVPRTATAAGTAKAGTAKAGTAKAGTAKAGAASSKAARPVERQSSWSEADPQARAAAAKSSKAPKAAASSSPTPSQPAAAAAAAATAASAAAAKKSQAVKRKRAEEASAKAAARRAAARMESNGSTASAQQDVEVQERSLTLTQTRALSRAASTCAATIDWPHTAHPLSAPPEVLTIYWPPPPEVSDAGSPEVIDVDEEDVQVQDIG